MTEKKNDETLLYWEVYTMVCSTLYDEGWSVEDYARTISGLVVEIVRERLEEVL